MSEMKINAIFFVKMLKFSLSFDVLKLFSLGALVPV